MQVVEIIEVLLMNVIAVLCYSTDFNSYGPVSIANTTAHRKGGVMKAPTAPGLGVEPLWHVLGDPVVDISA